MIKKTVERIFLSIFVLATGTLNADNLALPTADLIAPEVVHTPVTSTGENDLTFEATVTDNVAIKNVVLFYRSIGATSYQSVLMQPGTNNHYRHVISRHDISPPGIEYYIRAEDTAGNTLLHGFSFSPLIAQIDSTNGSESVTQSSDISATNKNPGGTSVEPIWKNKWLWAGVGILAVAVISNSGDDEPADTPTGDTIIIGPPE